MFPTFCSDSLIVFQNEYIFVQLDELDRITYGQIEFSNNLTQAQKTF